MDETLHGLAWSEVFALRNQLAWIWHRRHAQRIPLEEYWSAGNEALTRAAHVWTPASAWSWLHTLTLALTYAMRTVPRTDAPAGNTRANATGQRLGTRYPVTVCLPADTPQWDTLLRPVLPQLEQRAYVEELLTDLATQTSPAHVSLFVRLTWQLSTEREEARQQGTYRVAIQRRLRQGRQTIATRKPVWAALPPLAS